MTMLRILQVGVGGYGTTWLKTVLAAPDQATYVGLVDVDGAALAAAAAQAGVPTDRCFRSLAAALNTVEADAVLCIVPPAHHESVIVPALEAGLHVLSEKPISDSPAAMCRILAADRSSPGHLMISQKGRYHAWVRRFRALITANALGRLNHVTLHYRDALFQWGASGFRHRMDDPLLVEMSIHHFDLLRALLGRNALTVSGRSWNWAWSGFAGDMAASLLFTMEDDVPVIYEGNCISAGTNTFWYGDIRAECEYGSLVMQYPQLTIERRRDVPKLRREHVMDVTSSGAGQAVAFAEFLAAIAEQRAPETAATDNQHSMAMLFAAVEACHTGNTCATASYLAG
jgi:predicted dehydrogenase